MKKFNAEKELRKLKFRRNKGKYIKISFVALFVFIVFLGGFYFSKSKYEESGALQIINSKVDSFTYKDYIIASYIDGEETTTFPSKYTYTCIDSGCEVWINNTHTGTGCAVNSDWSLAACGGTVTGCSGASVSAGQDNNRTTCQSGYDWTKLGVNASTTGNMYGLYDMSGGVWEYVMGNMVNSSGGFYSSEARFSTAPDSKYYDSYAYSASTYTDHARGKLGDATRETLANFGSETGGWYNDYAVLPHGSNSWFRRGGIYVDGGAAGVLAFNRQNGYAWTDCSFRSVLVAE